MGLSDIKVNEEDIMSRIQLRPKKQKTSPVKASATSQQAGTYNIERELAQFHAIVRANWQK